MKNLILTISFILLVINTSAQTFSVEGKVLDSSNEGIPGVSIYVKNTNRGVVSDMEGYFHMSGLTTEDTLVFSYLGYVEQNIPCRNTEKSLEVKLAEDVMVLEEVVVIGYGTIKKSDLTGSVASVSTSDRTRYKPSKSRHKRTEAASVPAPVNPVTEPSAGLLTAGEVNDFAKWELWRDISANELASYQKTWKMSPQHRYTVQLLDDQRFPVINAEVVLKDERDSVWWTTRTDNTGKAELWAEITADSTVSSGFSAGILWMEKEYSILNLQEFHRGLNTLTLPKAEIVPDSVDVAFIVDATSSMSDEIFYLKRELQDVMQRIMDTLPAINLRLGSVFYRDHGDAYLTRSSALSADTDIAIDFVKRNTAMGGGDGPEAVEEALETTIKDLGWSENARTRITFLILDAPPHEREEDIKRIGELTRKAAAMGIRIVPVTCSGIGKSTEYLMRAIALYTNGTYTFLTDDSGIGFSHIKPTTDDFEVELLNDLLIRIVYQYSQIPEQEIFTSTNVQIDTITVLQPDTLTGEDVEKKPTRKFGLFSQKEEELNPQPAWKYYPNPTSGIVNVEMGLSTGVLYITDLSGKILERYHINSEEFLTLDLSSYPSGIYFITYEWGPDQLLHGKILVTR